MKAVILLQKTRRGNRAVQRRFEVSQRPPERLRQDSRKGMAQGARGIITRAVRASRAILQAEGRCAERGNPAARSGKPHERHHAGADADNGAGRGAVISNAAGE